MSKYNTKIEYHNVNGVPDLHWGLLESGESYDKIYFITIYIRKYDLTTRLSHLVNIDYRVI